MITSSKQLEEEKHGLLSTRILEPSLHVNASMAQRLCLDARRDGLCAAANSISSGVPRKQLWQHWLLLPVSSALDVACRHGDGGGVSCHSRLLCWTRCLDTYFKSTISWLSYT